MGSIWGGMIYFLFFCGSLVLGIGHYSKETKIGPIIIDHYSFLYNLTNYSSNRKINQQRLKIKLNNIDYGPVVVENSIRIRFRFKSNSHTFHTYGPNTSLIIPNLIHNIENSYSINEVVFLLSHNVYTSEHCGIYTNSTCYTHRKSCHLKYTENGLVELEYNSVISICHFFLFFYGHIFFDVLAPMMLIPERIRHNSHAIITIRKPIYIEAFVAIGFSEDRLIFIKPNEMVKCRYLYTLKNPACIDFFGEALHQLRLKLFNYYNLSSIKPSLYCLYNREGSRRIINFQDLQNSVSHAFPQFNWTVIPKQSSLRDTAQLFAQVKFIFQITGSGMSNCLFMHPKTTVVEVLCSHPNDCFAILTQVCQINHVIMKMINVPHFGPPFTIVIPVVLRGINKGLKLLNK